MLDGASLSALVVGGGRVATRKVAAMLEAGATVRVVAPTVAPELESMTKTHSALFIVHSHYSSDLLGDALLVVAATSDASVNARVAADARAGGRLVNVADAPELGNCAMPAVHRRGDIVVAVSAGGVPGAAGRIRDAMSRSIDARYATAVHDLAALRRALLDSGRRERWAEASHALVGSDFCEQVESGQYAARVAQWR